MTDIERLNQLHILRNLDNSHGNDSKKRVAAIEAMCGTWSRDQQPKQTDRLVLLAIAMLEARI
jgi:hypothetical protein